MIPSVSERMRTIQNPGSDCNLFLCASVPLCEIGYGRPAAMPGTHLALTILPSWLLREESFSSSPVPSPWW